MRTCAIIHPLHLELETAKSILKPDPIQTQVYMPAYVAITEVLEGEHGPLRYWNSCLTAPYHGKPRVERDLLGF